MNKTKITVRVDRDAYEAAKRYADRYGTTLTSLISEFLYSLHHVERSASRTPILDELTGILPADMNINDYYDHLEEKYRGER